MRDTFFDWRRFTNVCRKEMVENMKHNLLRLLLMYGTMTIILVWNAYSVYDHSRWETNEIENHISRFATVAFLWGIVTFGCLSASFTFEGMKEKRRQA